jgi:hypothetical protein
MRVTAARQRQGTKAGLCHLATVAEGQGAAGDKIVGPATIERAADMVEAAEEDSGLYGRGVLSGVIETSVE